MYFTKQEVDLIRAAAEAMPLNRRRERDAGKAQLSSLTDYASSSTLEALVLDIDVRQQAGKMEHRAAEALRRLMQTIALTDEESRRLPKIRDRDLSEEGRVREGQRRRERALCHKRAMAVRYVNKLRAER